MWNNQNPGETTKLLVFFNDTEAVKSQTYHAFESEDKKGTAIAGLTRRILQGKVFGKYKVAIFYQSGTEVQRWENGIRTK